MALYHASFHFESGHDSHTSWYDATDDKQAIAIAGLGFDTFSQKTDPKGFVSIHSGPRWVATIKRGGEDFLVRRNGGDWTKP